MALLKPLVCGKALDSGEKTYSVKLSDGYYRITIQRDHPPCEEWCWAVLDALEKINNKENRILCNMFGSKFSIGAKIENENDVELIESYLNLLDEFITEDS